MKRLLSLLTVITALAACAPVDYCDGSSDVAKDSAVFAAHNLVRERLKAPASAKGPSGHRDDGVSVGMTGQCRWSVSSYVDAQNSFGAMIRTRYLAVVRAQEDGRFTLEAVYFSE